MAAARAEGNACDDGDPCTAGDLCASGQCAGTAIDCSHLDEACAVGRCEGAQGCVAVVAPDDTACDDSDPCSQNDRCSSGYCAGEPADGPTCFDGNPCSKDDRCVQGICRGTPDVGAPCVDSDACTVADRCTPAAECAGGPMDCSALDGFCAQGACDPALGACLAMAREGEPCEDADVCTADTTCGTAPGECGGGTVNACCANPPDDDGDTYAAQSCGGDDCDDGNSDVHPGVPESCDRIDQDCDGLVDEGFAYVSAADPVLQHDPNGAQSWTQPAIARGNDSLFMVAHIQGVHTSGSPNGWTRSLATTQLDAAGTAIATGGAYWSGYRANRPRIAHSTSGYGLAWFETEEIGTPVTQARLFFMPLDASGRTAAGATPIVIEDVDQCDSPECVRRPGIASDGNEYMFSWVARNELHVTVTDSTGTILHSPPRIDGGEYMSTASLEWNGTWYGLAYSRRGPGEARVWFLRLTTDGLPAGLPISLSGESDDIKRPEIAWDGDRWGIVWENDGGIHARVLDVSGNPMGDEFVVVPKNTIKYQWPVVVAASGQFIFAARNPNAVIVGRFSHDGRLVTPTTILPPPEHNDVSVDPVDAVWDGTHIAVVHGYRAKEGDPSGAQKGGMAFARLGCPP